MTMTTLYDLEITEQQYTQVVWESEEKLKEFSEVLVPALTASGVEESQPTIHPVHNIMKPNLLFLEYSPK